MFKDGLRVGVDAFLLVRIVLIRLTVEGFNSYLKMLKQGRDLTFGRNKFVAVCWYSMVTWQVLHKASGNHCQNESSRGSYKSSIEHGSLRRASASLFR